ncbi:MAG: zinc metalloprotease HtpX [Nitrospinota bacterium]
MTTNSIKTYILLAALTALILLIGQAIGGRSGLVMAVILAAVMNLGSYWYSDRIVLSMYRAREVTEREAPDLYRMVRDMSLKGGLPMPKLYVIPKETPNAFATGRNPEHSAVAVTEGLVRLLDREEIRGVLAHELSHIRNRDILISTIAATIAGAIMWLATMAQWAAIFGGAGRDDEEGGGGGLGLLLVAILAPIAALLLQMAISRSREYLADATGARLAGSARGLAGALRKLDYAAKRIPMEASPATAHMFIVNPLSGGGMNSLFSTHPPIEKRIERLLTMAPY